MFTNNCTFIGRITKDVEVVPNTNTPVCKFKIAIDNGQDKPATFIRVTAFSKAAESLAKHGKKGVLLGVETRYEESTYKKDGQTVYTHDFIVSEYKYLAFPNNANANNGQQQQPNGQNNYYSQQQSEQNFGGYPSNQPYNNYSDSYQGAPTQNQNFNNNGDNSPYGY